MPPHFAFRGIFIFSNNGNIVFSNRFQTVESRVPAESPKIPPNEIISNFFKEEAQNSLNQSSGNFTFELAKDIFLVVLPVKNFYLSLIPFIDNTNESSKTPSIEISAAFSFLSFLESIFRSVLKTLTNDSPPSAFAPIRQLVSLVLPFGSPVVNDPYFASQLTSAGDARRFSAGYQTIAPAAVPSWKTFLIFPRPQLELKLREVVLALIDGERKTLSSYGEVKCISQISYLPDITMNIKNFDNAREIASHFCIRKFENNKTITFSPPTGITQLILWRNQNLPNITFPVDGLYEIQETNDSGISFSLKISIHGPTQIVIQLPFPDRGAITKHQFSSPGGQLKMSKKEATLSWTPPIEEDKTATLAGTLYFEKQPEKSERLKAYISFNVKKQSFSGAEIEKESITFSTSSSNTTLQTESSYVSESKKYIILASPLNK